MHLKARGGTTFKEFLKKKNEEKNANPGIKLGSA